MPEIIDPNIKETDYFNRKFKKAYKKHPGSFETDFNNFRKTICANFEQTRNTDRIQLGEKYSSFLVYKTRMFVKECKGYDCRVIWYHNKELNYILFIDIYLKSQQSNHEIPVILDALNELNNNA